MALWKWSLEVYWKYSVINLTTHILVFSTAPSLWIFDPEKKSHLCLQKSHWQAHHPPHSPTHTQTDRASAVFFPAYKRIRPGPALYLDAWFPFLCVICDVEQVSEALVGDELVVRRDNACVSPRRSVSLFLFPLQPPLLLQDFLPGNQTELFVPPDNGLLLFYSCDTFFILYNIWFPHS